MVNNLSASVSVLIDATPAEVWKAITTPALIRKYLMGTTVTSTFQEGDPITYEGEYNGKKYRDKGTIEKVRPEKLFRSTYWSSMGGKEDKPENYNGVSYVLTAQDDQKTLVTLEQDNIQTEAEKQHVTLNWKSVLEQLRDVVEKEVVVR